jgi:hypothetical protein
VEARYFLIYERGIIFGKLIDHRKLCNLIDLNGCLCYKSWIVVRNVIGYIACIFGCGDVA